MILNPKFVTFTVNISGLSQTFDRFMLVSVHNHNTQAKKIVNVSRVYIKTIVSP